VQLRHLKSFVAVYEAGGFRPAAEAEHLTQPAVSRHIRSLEQDLGVTLFVRTPTGAVPTEAGEALYADVAGTLCSLTRALDRARAAGRGTVSATVGYIAPAMRGPLPVLLSAVRDEWPDAEVRLHEMTSAAVVEGLRSGGVDIGFFVPDGPAPDLAVAALSRLDYRIVVSARDPLAGRAEVALADLDGRVLVTVAPHEAAHGRILEAIRAHAPSIRTQPAFGFSEVHSLVVAGVGVAAVPPVPGDTLPPGVTLLRPVPALPSAVLAVAVRRGWRSPLAGIVTRLPQMWAPAVE
jgi:DNA-binding transcriptional LysR family regulator